MPHGPPVYPARFASTARRVVSRINSPGAGVHASRSARGYPSQLVLGQRLWEYIHAVNQDRWGPEVSIADQKNLHLGARSEIAKSRGHSMVSKGEARTPLRVIDLGCGSDVAAWLPSSPHKPIPSKTVTATLPAGLLVIFWWKRGTLGWRRDVTPLIPFFALATIAGIFTSWAERSLVGARGAEFEFSAIERLLNAGRSFLFYLRQLLWPADLIFIYPRWRIDSAHWWQYFYPVSVVALILIAWAVRARTRAPLAALLYFGITLGPALGFVNVYPFRFSFVADHFQYLAGVGVMALIAALVDRLISRLKTPSPALRRTAAALAFGLILGLLTWHQSKLYADPRILYEETLRRNPTAWLAHLNLGFLANQVPSKGKAAAIAHYRAALTINPTSPKCTRISARR